eukprot:8502833-Ditylum_brightwellii.AAC.1
MEVSLPLLNHHPTQVLTLVSGVWTVVKKDKHTERGAKKKKQEELSKEKKEELVSTEESIETAPSTDCSTDTPHKK